MGRVEQIRYPSDEDMPDVSGPPYVGTSSISEEKATMAAKGREGKGRGAGGRRRGERGEEGRAEGESINILTCA
jgi:hypothetical protein